ncbi:MAG TPA: heparinase II/III-family protein, partial [Gemmatimonadaceae bacterium]
ASANMMVLDAGPHGFLNAGHAHADTLALELVVSGSPVFIDPGTFTYTLSPAWRDVFRETAAHNAATVDGCSSATVAGPFQWASRAESRCEQWEVDEREGMVLFAGSHNGFERLRPAVRYTRFVAYFEPDLWIVRDEIEGAGEHELAVHWQCAPGLTCHGGAGTLVLSRGRSEVLVMHVLEMATWRFSDGWISPAYGVREVGSHVTCSARGNGKAHLTAILHQAGHALFTGHEHRDGAPGIRVRWRDRDGVLFFADRRVSWTPSNA